MVFLTAVFFLAGDFFLAGAFLAVVFLAGACKMQALANS